MHETFYFQIFHFRVDQENRLSNMFPPEVLPQMFANIKSIYKFHAEFLLPQVSEILDGATVVLAKVA